MITELNHNPSLTSPPYLRSFSPSDDPLPGDMIFKIFTFLPTDVLPVASLTCCRWKHFTWTSYWDRVFTYTDCIAQPEKTILKTAAARLVFLFNSSDLKDRNKISEFIERCCKLEVTHQVNFIRNITVSLRLKNSDFENLLINLFKHFLCPLPCKMKIIDLVRSLKLTISLPSDENLIEKGLLPHHKPFKLEVVPKNLANTIQVHKEHTFENEELVAVIDGYGLSKGKSTLYFGRIKEKINNLWRIYLGETGSGKPTCVILKSTGEIGKFPERSELPIFLQFS